jgi:Lrp/AsnC family transcriptional regulator for asnA, asnC and gidA
VIKGGMDSGNDRRRPRLPPRTAIDPVSKSIIELLQQDGRRPYAEVAAALGISEDEVERRVRRLTERGVIQIVAVTDPLQLGFARQAMLGVAVQGPLDHVVAALTAIEEVVYVVVTAGDFDVLVEVVGDSDAHLLELVTSRIRPIPGVTSIHTFLYLELAKQTYTWGVR